jgi:DHA2 family multidrug resistance protein
VALESRPAKSSREKLVSASPAAIAAPAPALTGARKTVTALALALGTFMQVLDTSIANVSIPTIAGNLGVSSDQGTWVITSFAVANGVSVPLTGWLMQRFEAPAVTDSSVSLLALKFQGVVLFLVHNHTVGNAENY